MITCLKKIFPLFFLLTCFKADAQLLFQKRYELGTVQTLINGIVQRTNDTYFTIGGFSNPGPVGYTHLMCLDTTGSILWERAYEGPGDMMVKNVDGTFTISSAFGDEFAFLKIDSMGNPLVQKYFGFQYIDNIKNIIPTADSGNLIMGYFNWNPTTYGPFYGGVVKIDAAGNIQWIKKYGSYTTTISDAIELPGEGYLLYGYTTDFSDTIDYYYSDIILLKVDTLGNIISSKMIQTPGVDESFRFFKKENGNFLFTLITSAFNSFGGTQKVIMETDSNLNQIWAKRYVVGSSMGMDRFVFLKKTKDNGVIFCPGPIIKLDSLGNFQWKRSASGISGYHDIIENTDSNFITVGITGNNPAYGFAIALNHDGTLCNQISSGFLSIDTVSLSFQPILFNDSTILLNETTGVFDTSFTTNVYTDCFTAVSVPEFSNINNQDIKIYPSIFSEFISIEFENNFRKSLSSVTLLNSIGQQINIFDRSHGDQIYFLNTQFLPSGIYILKIQSEKYIFTKKLIKIN